MSDFGVDDDRGGFDVSRSTTKSGKLRVVAATLALAAVVAFATGIWFAYDQGVRKTTSAPTPPLILAETGPTKIKPENPGGLQVPNQDKQIFDRTTSATSTRGAETRKVERLLPPPERPLPETPARAAPAQTAAITLVPITPEPSPPQEQQLAAVVPPSASIQPLVTAAGPAAVGGIRIQLAAHRDAAAAEAAWKKLQHGHGDVLGPLVLNLERADLGDKGVFYRLQAGPFTDRVAASAACEQLKARNLGCIVAGK